MVLPAILGGLATGVGSALPGFLGGLFGGGNKSQAQAFDSQAFLNSYTDQMTKINNDLIKFLDDKSAQYDSSLNQYKAQYKNPQTEANFKANFQTYLDTANNANNSGAMSTEQAKNWFQNLALEAGLTPGSVVNDKGNTLMDVMTAFDTKKLNNIPKEWDQNLNVIFKDFLGRNATDAERAQYNMKDYNNIDAVKDSLARNNKDFYARNLGTYDPSTKAAADFWTGGAVAIYDDPYKRFGLDSKTGKPLEATSKLA